MSNKRSRSPSAYARNNSERQAAKILNLLALTIWVLVANNLLAEFIPIINKYGGFMLLADTIGFIAYAILDKHFNHEDHEGEPSSD